MKLVTGDLLVPEHGVARYVRVGPVELEFCAERPERPDLRLAVSVSVRWWRAK